jgi:flagellin-like hook-associated protein FlgL
MGHIAQRSNIINNQGRFAEESSKLNTQKRYLHNYDSPDGGKELVQLAGQIMNYQSVGKNQSKAVTELELTESSLNTMKDTLDQIRTSALQGASDTLNSDDLVVLGKELRELGESFYTSSNTKIGNRYLFGGVQTDKKVISFVPGAVFANATYKEGESDEGERSVEGTQSSIGLGDLYTAQKSSAQYTGSAPGTLPLAANAELNLVVNDGYNDINIGNVALSAGDSLATIATKINTAFNTAGGQGSIVQVSSGALEFDTALITNNKENERATIILNPGSNLPNTLSSLGLVANTTKGTSTNMRDALTNLEAAYNSGDTQAIRESLVDIEANLDRLISVKSKLGDLVKKFSDSAQNSSFRETNLSISQSEAASLPAAEAIQSVTSAQATLTGSMQAAAKIMSTSIFNFLSL